ncbi:hypothetical protein J3F84DRAFT_347407 [Trichoderma pleuroticola]|uniref:Uncharacterized protein n=1 Tax=Trichoderma harzianum TaxID=5544 RepID=A0A2K0TW27_TRIHA|nr:hypothetical protein THARTR1_09459 [Trichoderma harzianum]
MQFSIMTVFALAAVAIAAPTGFARREVVDNSDVPANVPSMTDASGNVIAFKAQEVYVPPN